MMPEPDWEKVSRAVSAIANQRETGKELPYLMAAARWALKAHKQGKRVWWCEEHNCGSPDLGVECPAVYHSTDYDLGKCRMVERLLIPLDSEEGT